MSKVAKSLSDLDALADEVLSKSVKDDKEDLKPEEISENVPDDASKDNPENNAPAAGEPKAGDVKKDDIDDKKDAEDGAEEDLEKCGNLDSGVKKSDDSKQIPEEEEEPAEDTELKDEDEDEDEDEDLDNKDDLEKSIKSDFDSDDEIRKGMDASEFLSSVVEILSKSLADTTGEIQINRADNRKQTSILAKSLQAALGLSKSMAEEITEIKKENIELKKSLTDGLTDLKALLEDVLSQPVGMRKSVKNIHVMDRNFQKSLNGGDLSGIESLSKSQIMDILVSELHAGNQLVTANDVVAFESGAPLRTDLITLVNNKCK